MSKTNIAASGLLARLQTSKRLKKVPVLSSFQRGLSLVELMVGIAIGLLVVAVAMGAMMVSRGISGTVSDAAGIQQQAAYAMRVIGQQLRQTGSLRLNLNPSGVTGTEELLSVVGLELQGATDCSDPATCPLGGADSSGSASDSLTVRYTRYTEPVFTGTSNVSLSRNCLGGPADTSTAPRIENIFDFNTTASELRCAGNDPTRPQPIVQNVANFRVRYLLQDNTTPGVTSIQYVTAAGVGTNWSRVQGVEVCLVLYGNEPVDIPAPTTALPNQGTYVDCDGTRVNMTTLTGNRARRIHIPFRNVFQLRSQGLM